MGIRLIVPLPGPFAYMPGRKHAKTSASAGGPSLTDQVAAHNQRDRHAHAVAFAEHVDYSEPERFADEVEHIHRAQRTLWALAGIAVGILAVLVFIGPGALLLAVVPVIGFPFLAIVATPGVIAALVATRRARIFELACRELEIAV